MLVGVSGGVGLFDKFLNVFELFFHGRNNVEKRKEKKTHTHTTSFP
jgi:hypothetical protein